MASSLKESLTLVKLEMKGFCESTSMKGVPRIIKSQLTFLRVYWLLIVLISLTLATWIGSDLVYLYLSYPTKNIVVEYNLNNDEDLKQVSEKYGSNFPALSACNLKPSASNVEMPEDVLTLTEFYRTIEEIGLNTSVTELADEIFGEEQSLNIWEYFYSSGYLMSIPWEAAAQAMNLEETFINTCNIQVTTNGIVRTVPCKLGASIQTMVTDKYFVCYIISVNSNVEQYGKPIGISAIFYIDNFGEHVPYYFDSSNLGDDTGTGVHVIPHFSGFYPNLKDGITVRPGDHMTLNMMVEGVTRLDQPYGDCQNGDGLNYYDIYGNGYNYHEDICYTECMHKKVMDQCNCIPKMSVLSSTNQLDNETDAFMCGRIYFENITHTLYMTKCMVDVIENIGHSCSKTCKRRCTEVIFTARTVSHAKWPSRNNVIAFYATHVHQQAYASSFSDYKHLWDSWVHDNISDQELLNRIDILDQIENNFVQVTVMDDYPKMLSYESAPSFNFVMLWSTLGGGLNLYTGITCMIIFEMVEATVKIIVSLRKSLYDKNRAIKVQPK